MSSEDQLFRMMLAGLVSVVENAPEFNDTRDLLLSGGSLNETRATAVVTCENKPADVNDYEKDVAHDATSTESSR